MTTEVSLLV